ncbi:MAG: polynucleotide kinase-phosphatase, partial [Chlorobia bacterium]|nr:polynucleotide kinase-phosphatase [Fimbriimonadaceae bacterium]
IIGDIHGCFEELSSLLSTLGYRVEEQAPESLEEGASTRHWESMQWFQVECPENRRVVFLGDLVDRGPDSVRVLKLAMSMVAAGQALCVPGNHDDKLLRKLSGKDVRLTHGLAETWEQLLAEPEEFRQQVGKFLRTLIGHYWLDGGNLAVAHAGMKDEMQGRSSGQARSFGLYGETTGETDEFGLPIRYNWAAEYRGKAHVVYGHTPVPEAEWLNRTINIDTGCVFGGKLTALRYPEKELVSVPALRTYAEPRKPFLDAPNLAAQHEADDLLVLEDVLGRRAIHTELKGNITVREENATAALEVMSRFATNPKWLTYLPPTMSPCETSTDGNYLEHPDQAFAYFTSQGIEQVICEEKHMGSRAVVVVCRDVETTIRRFGVAGEGRGVIYTRTGRRFYESDELESGMLEAVSNAFGQGLWDELETDWAILDCELMPWSAKAQELIRRQYAAVGCAANHALRFATNRLAQAAGRDIEGVADLVDAFARKSDLAGKFVASYRKYCWPVESLADYKLAPFHLLATEGKVHTDRDHVWHMEIASQLADADSTGVVMRTNHRTVDLGDAADVGRAVDWWIEMTCQGGEGMVVKPSIFIARGSKGLLQPAIKCRGPEYLRIIYGPEYSEPANLARLRKRGLARKRSLALAEFALGIEGLTRIVNREPLRRVHECAFGVLAMESEPVDPRL